MKYIKQLTIALVLFIGLGVVIATDSVSAINVFQACSSGDASDTAVCNASNTDDLSGAVKNVVNIMLYILGAIAIVVIVIAGVMYTVSGGDNSAVAKAKNTILYAVIGLVVAILAYAIVNFVIGSF